LKALKKDELAKAESERLLKKEASSKKTTTVVVSAAPAKRTDSHTGSSSTTQKVTSYTTSAASESAKQSLKKMSLPELLKVRILQRNLVYVIGLAPKIAKNDILDKFEYFKQYGKIQKIIVNKNNVYNSTAINGPSYSAYITFSNDFEASVAILAVDQFDIFDRTIRASYGTTKYCTFFLRDQSCPNPDCLYLHRAANEKDTFMKDESSNNKSVFIDQQKMAVEHLQKHLPEIDKIIASQAKNVKTVFPSMDTIRTKIKEYLEQNPPQIEKTETQENKKAALEERKTLSTEKDGSQKKTASQTDQESESNRTDKKLGFENTETESDGKASDEKINKSSSKADLNSEQISDYGGSYPDDSTSKKDDSVTQGREAQDNMFEMQENEMLSDNLTPNYSRKESVNYSHQGQQNDLVGDKEDDLEFKSSGQTDFDKRILRNLLLNINNSQISRFRFAQEENEIEKKHGENDSEYNLLYKSIQSQMNISPSVFNSILDGNNKNKFLETIQNLINDLEENANKKEGSSSLAEGKPEGSEETPDSENIEKDSTGVNDIKTSGSKKRGKNKRRKDSNLA